MQPLVWAGDYAVWQAAWYCAAKLLTAFAVAVLPAVLMKPTLSLWDTTRQEPAAPPKAPAPASTQPVTPQKELVLDMSSGAAPARLDIVILHFLFDILFGHAVDVFKTFHHAFAWVHGFSRKLRILAAQLLDMRCYALHNKTCHQTSQKGRKEAKETTGHTI